MGINLATTAMLTPNFIYCDSLLICKHIEHYRLKDGHMHSFLYRLARGLASLVKMEIVNSPLVTVSQSVRNSLRSQMMKFGVTMGVG